jgi:hypothetical protein
MAEKKPTIRLHFRSDFPAHYSTHFSTISASISRGIFSAIEAVRVAESGASRRETGEMIFPEITGVFFLTRS